MAEEVKLLGVTGSPFSSRVEIALKLKGIQYEFIEEDIYGKKSELLLKNNPVYKKIPVFFHNGRPILESLIIVEYIDEKWKGSHPFLPEDPHEKALARFWAKFIDDKCIPAAWKAFRSRGEEQSRAVEETRVMLKTLENELKGKKFFGGEKIGLVDIAAGFIGFWLGSMQEVNGMDLFTKEKFPKLTKWTEEFLKSEAVQETLPPRDHLLGFYRNVLEQGLKTSFD